MREGKRNRFIWIAKEIQNAGFLCAHSGVHHMYDLSAMVPPVYKKPPGPKDTGGQTGNLLYKYYTTHWQNVNDTMLVWCG